MNRHSEDGTPPRRSPRFSKRDNYWYYRTREGFDIGPFDTLSAAESGASDFIDFVTHAEPQIVESLSRYGTAARHAATAHYGAAA